MTDAQAPTTSANNRTRTQQGHGSILSRVSAVTTLGGAAAENEAVPIRERTDALLAAYREVDRASLLLPALGSTEGWSSFLIGPVSLLLARARSCPVLLRQVRAAPSAWDALKRMLDWLLGDGFGPWRGEALLSIAAVSRPLVSSLLAAHFRRRLSLLRRWIVLGEPAKANAALLAEIDAALSIWKVRRTISGAVTFVLSLAGAVGGLVGIIHGVEGMPWYGWVLIGLALYAVYLFVVGSFITKRGLMLGRSAESAYRPASLPKNGTYGVERTLFEPLRISRAETPLDLVLASLFLALFAAFMFAVHLPVLGGIFIAAFVVNAFAYLRRRRLCRL